MPTICDRSPRAPVCQNASIYYLDQARKGLGQGPYALPADFTGLPPEQQAFVLTNLDRVQYGLPPVPGLTAALNQDAMSGVQRSTDPTPSEPGLIAASNWAGGFANMPLAYEAWMYDDGPGSGNLDCGPTVPAGCWGHRHTVLSAFDPSSGPVAMGAAGQDSGAHGGYAMLIAQGFHSNYNPVYVYTWQQALADGAGTHPYDPGLPQIPVRFVTTVRGSGLLVDATGNGCRFGECTLEGTQGIPETVLARADPGWRFVGWSGPCTGAGACTFAPLVKTPLLTATFARMPQIKVLSISVRSRVVRVKLSAPAGRQLQCALTSRRSAQAPRFRACTTRPVYRSVPRGAYVFRARTSTLHAHRSVTVR